MKFISVKGYDNFEDMGFKCGDEVIMIYFLCVYRVQLFRLVCYNYINGYLTEISIFQLKFT